MLAQTRSWRRLARRREPSRSGWRAGNRANRTVSPHRLSDAAGHLLPYSASQRLQSGCSMLLDFSVAYANVVNSLLTGNRDVAAQTLGAVPNWQAPAESRYIPRNVPTPLQVTVFRRDHFTCRYCGRRAVLPPVLRLLSGDPQLRGERHDRHSTPCACDRFAC